MKFSFDVLLQLIQLPLLAIVASGELLRNLGVWRKRKPREEPAPSPPHPTELKTSPDPAVPSHGPERASPEDDQEPSASSGPDIMIAPLPAPLDVAATTVESLAIDDFDDRPQRDGSPFERPLKADDQRVVVLGDQSDESQPRYANIECRNIEGVAVRDAASLGVTRQLTIRIDIGALKKTSLVENPRPVPEDKLPPDAVLDVVLVSRDFVFLDGTGGFTARQARSTLHLPGGGGPAIGPDGQRHVDFPAAVVERGEATCEIGLHYRGAVIQSFTLIKEAETADAKGRFTVREQFALSSEPAALAQVPRRSRVSLLAQARKEGMNQIILYSPDGTLVSDAIYDIDVAGVSDAVRRLRGALDERAPRQRQRSRRDLENDLRALAPIGAELFQLLPAQNLAQLQPLFDGPEDTVIHIARATSSTLVAPWAFVYDIPFTGETPMLCEAVAGWDEASPLFSPGARSCPCGPHRENVLCPFGFWGFRYPIEQIVSTQKTSAEIQVGASSSLVAARAAYDVDEQALSHHLRSLEGIFRQRFSGISVREGKDKQTIRALIGQDLPFLYFYCHGESDDGKNVYLGVGRREPITTMEFGNWLLSWRKNDRLMVWDKTRPLVFINACNSAAVYPDTVISFVEAFVGRANAAGVIGTEVKVSQTLAMQFAERFFTGLMKEGATVDTALRDVRMQFLADGNLFGLVYTPYCWADLQVVNVNAA